MSGETRGLILTIPPRAWEKALGGIPIAPLKLFDQIRQTQDSTDTLLVEVRSLKAHCQKWPRDRPPRGRFYKLQVEAGRRLLTEIDRLQTGLGIDSQPQQAELVRKSDQFEQLTAGIHRDEDGVLHWPPRIVNIQDLF